MTFFGNIFKRRPSAPTVAVSPGDDSFATHGLNNVQKQKPGGASPRGISGEACRSKGAQPDVAMLDKLDPGEFLRVLRSSVDCYHEDVWELMGQLVSQLKGCRNLLALSSYLTTPLSEQEVLEKILDSGYLLLNADRLSLYEVDHKTMDLVLTHTKDRSITNTRIPIGRGIAGEVALHNHIVNTTDAYSDPRFFPALDQQTGYRTQSVLCFPISVDGQVKAVIQALNKKTAINSAHGPQVVPFSSNDEIMCGFLAAQAAVALKSAQMLRSTIQERELVENLISLLFNSTRDLQLQSIVHKLMNAALESLDVEGIALFLETEDRSELVCHFPPHLDNIAVDPTKGIIGCCFMENKQLNVADMEQDPEIDNILGCKVTQAIAGPVCYQDGAPLGVLIAYNRKQGGSFQARDELLLRDLCIQTAFVVVTASRCEAHSPQLPSVSSARRSISEIVPSSLSDPMSRILKHARIAFQAEFTAFYAYDAAEDRIANALRCTSDEDVSIVETTATTDFEQALLAARIARDRIQQRLPQSTSFPVDDQTIMLPVVRQQAVTGVLLVQRLEENPFLPSEQDAVVQFVGMISKLLDQSGVSSETQQRDLLLANAALGAMKHYIVILNPRGELVYCNWALRDILGADRSIMGHFKLWLLPEYGSLCRDVETVFAAGTSKHAEDTVLQTPAHPNGILVSYKVKSLKTAHIHTTGGTPRTRPRLDTPEFCRSEASTPRSRPRSDTSNSGTGSLWKQETLGVIIILDVGARATEIPDASGNMPTIEGTLDAICTTLSNLPSKYEIDSVTQHMLGTVTASIVSLKDDMLKQFGGTPDRSSTKFRQRATTIHNWSTESVDVVALRSWDFDVLQIQSEQHLRVVVRALFEQLGAVIRFPRELETLGRFIVQIEKNYRKNAFHNFRHATTVTHMSFMLLTNTGAATMLSETQKFTVLISAMCHDVDHPGNTNAFEINSSSELALQYNDQSVLENHHCSTAFRLMRDGRCNVFQSMTGHDAKESRKLMIACILATDMAMHFQLVVDLNKKLDSSDGWQVCTDIEQHFLAKILLHAADLSNPVRPFHMAAAWAVLIAEEFNEQVKKEEELGLPVLNFMVTNTERELAKNENNFVSFVVEPFWRALVRILPDVQICLDNLENNQEQWRLVSEGFEELEVAHSFRVSE